MHFAPPAFSEAAAIVCRARSMYQPYAIPVGFGGGGKRSEATMLDENVINLRGRVIPPSPPDRHSKTSDQPNRQLLESTPIVTARAPSHRRSRVVAALRRGLYFQAGSAESRSPRPRCRNRAGLLSEAERRAPSKLTMLTMLARRPTKLTMLAGSSSIANEDKTKTYRLLASRRGRSNMSTAA